MNCNFYVVIFFCPFFNYSISNYIKYFNKYFFYNRFLYMCVLTLRMLVSKCSSKAKAKLKIQHSSQTTCTHYSCSSLCMECSYYDRCNNNNNKVCMDGEEKSKSRTHVCGMPGAMSVVKIFLYSLYIIKIIIIMFCDILCVK